MADHFFARARELEQQGRPFATATVVRVERPTSGRPGDKAVVTLEGELFGWVGGSCSRPTVVEEARKAIREDRARLIRLSADAPDPKEKSERQGLTDLSMTCFSGGTMEIFIEPHQPKPRLAVVGDQPVARALVDLGTVLGFEIASGDLEPAGLHPLSFVVVATHGEGDEIALEVALESSAPYVGLVASPKRAESIRSYLRKQGLSEDDVGRMRAPAGLDIQAQSPEEIALSILAEIIQVRRNLKGIDWPELDRKLRAETAVPETTAVDPTCGMTVEIATAQVTLRHGGSTYYFCCVGCRDKFQETAS